MKKNRLLLSGAGGSLFPYVSDSLKKKYKVYLIDSNPLMKKLYKNEKCIIVPPVLDPSYEKKVIQLIKKHKIDFYIPLIDEEILKAINIASKTKVKVLSPQKKFVELTLNKFNLMKKLKHLNISDIPTKMGDKIKTNPVNYPLFVKPNIGRGSRGIKKITNDKEYKAYFILEEYAPSEVLVQPYIGGQEYTVSVTVNNLNQIISIVPKIVFIKQGITKHAQSLQHKKIETLCKKIVKTLKPCGSFNVQLKEYNGELFIFEINPRFSTTLVLSIASGINEIDLNISYYNKKTVKYIDKFKEISLIRRWENVFIKG